MMAGKLELRDIRSEMVINQISKRQEKALDRAVQRVIVSLREKFGPVVVAHQSQWLLRDVVDDLRRTYPDIDFHYHFERSAMRPDGGILSIVSKNERIYPILIAEKKNQGTNDLRKQEGLKKQAKGNAIERLGKNVIGFRAAMKSEGIFPFVCFGDGCDFDDDSSILDRVVTIAMFGNLNKEYVMDLGGAQAFDRGTFYFRTAEWSENEMYERCLSIAIKSVYHYFAAYGEESFL